MDLISLTKLHVFILLSFLFLQATGEGSRSVVFLDGPDHRYLRGHSSGIAGKIDAMTPEEVASIVSVLLGFAPSSSLPSESSAKLNEVILPNPFDKPRAVFVLEVKGTEATLPSITHSHLGAGSSFTYKIAGSNKADIEISDEDEVSVVSIDEPFDDTTCLDKAFADLAHLLGGSYVGSIKSLDGELSFALADGSSLNLHVSKQADLGFALSLASLVRGIKKAVEMHEDLTGSIKSPAELLTGVFTGIEALNEYGPDATNKGLELFHTALSLLQNQYKGKIVGVILCSNEAHRDSGAINVKFPTKLSRELQEVGDVNVIIPVIYLVRTSLAWITGIILLVATLIGVYLLLNMPLTRDTLLYSNVKLD